MLRLLIAACCLCAAGARAGVGEWRTHTPKKEVRSLAASGSEVWAATAGGLFSFHPGTGAYRSYTTSEGLRTIDLTAVAADPSGTIWIGAAGGLLHRFRPSLGEWTVISDIERLDAARKRINALRIWGDSLIVLSDAGLSVYSIGRGEFADSYLRFGGGAAQISGDATGAERHAGRLWVSTRFGVASTPASNPNPSEPSTWQVHGVADGLPTARVTALLAAGDSLYAATSGGIAVWTGASWRTVTGAGGIDAIGLALPGGSCERALFLTPSAIGAIDGAGAARLLGGPAGLAAAAIADGGYVGTADAGALLFEACPAGADTPGVRWTALPPGPASGRFVSVAVDEGGWVWAATGKTAGEGFMSFDGSAWRSFTSASHPALRWNDYFAVSAGPGNVKYVGGWGPGLAVIGPDNELETVLSTASGLPPTVGTDPFVVVGGVGFDRNGTAWIAPRTPPGDTTLVTRAPDGTLDYVTGCMFEPAGAGGACVTRSQTRVLTDVVIDDFGTKWFANYNRFETEGPLGLYYYNETRALPGTREGWGKMTDLDGLPSNQVWSLAADRFGDLWVGTNLGIAIIYSPLNPKASVAPYRPLPDQIVQDIAVDPLNRKWVATKRGVFLLSQDGTTVIERYTVESTGGRLLDDDVASIAIDPRTGVVWFGTEKGLSGLSTPAAAPNRSFGSLTVYPNPFAVPAATPLTVDGLVAGSSLKVFTVDGVLVRAVATPGGRLGFWDGLDGEGAAVSTGIYIVVAYSEAGTEVGSAKVAVIRR